MEETLFAARAGDVLELDEAWSFVLRPGTSTGSGRRCAAGPRQVVAFVCGGRGGDACRAGERVPRAYRKCRSFSDFWKAYADILPEGTHRCVRREAGETAHMERWYNTRALPPQDPLLLQEGLAARSSDPLVHRRVQPLMLRVARIGA